MERLTEKDRYGHFYTNKANCRNIYSLDGEKLEGVFFENQVLAIDGEAIDKLGQLEDIEEEIGIELTTLFKALKYGVYYYTSQNQLTHDYVWLYDNYVSASVRDKLSYSLLTCFQKQILSFEDYGTTWSLDKGELEK